MKGFLKPLHAIVASVKAKREVVSLKRELEEIIKMRLEYQNYLFRLPLYGDEDNIPIYLNDGLRAYARKIDYKLFFKDADAIAASRQEEIIHRLHSLGERTIRRF